MLLSHNGEFWKSVFRKETERTEEIVPMCAQNDSRLLHHDLAYLNSTIGHCLLDDHDTTSWCIDASTVQVEELGANYLAIAE